MRRIGVEVQRLQIGPVEAINRAGETATFLDFWDKPLGIVGSRGRVADFISISSTRFMLEASSNNSLASCSGSPQKLAIFPTNFRTISGSVPNVTEF